MNCFSPEEPNNANGGATSGFAKPCFCSCNPEQSREPAMRVQAEAIAAHQQFASIDGDHATLSNVFRAYKATPASQVRELFRVADEPPH
jgi:hypothetical protein